MKNTTLALGAIACTLLVATPAHAKGQLFIANLNGAGVSPPTTSLFTGTGYAVLDDDEARQTYWAYHNIDGTLTGGEIRRGVAGTNGSGKFTFTDPTSPLGPVPTIVLSPAADGVLMRSGGIYMQFLTTAFPNGAIRGQFVPYNFAPQAVTAQQQAVANALDLSSGFDDDLNETIVSIARLSAANQATAFEQMSARALSAQSSEMLDSLSTLQFSLFTHADEAASPRGHLTYFLKAGYSFGKRGGTTAQLGADVDRPYFMGGVDYALTDNAVVGIAVGFADGTDKLRDGLSKTSVSTTTGMVYFSAALDRLVVQGVGQYGVSAIETSRNMSALSTTTMSTHHGEGWSAALKASVPFQIGGGSSIAPYALVDVQSAFVNAYDEDNAAGLSVPKIKDKSSGGEIGASFRGPLGPSLALRLDAGWHKSFGTHGKDVTTSFVGSGATFTSRILGHNEGAARLGAALTTDRTNWLYGEIGYQGYLSQRTKTHGLEARVTIKM